MALLTREQIDVALEKTVEVTPIALRSLTPRQRIEMELWTVKKVEGVLNHLYESAEEILGIDDDDGGEDAPEQALEIMFAIAAAGVQFSQLIAVAELSLDSLDELGYE